MSDTESLVQEVKRLYKERKEWKEGLKLEFKLAEGGLPNKELRRTYSAFANTVGGILILGVTDDGVVKGVPNIDKRHKELVDLLNNSQQVSCNLCARPGFVEKMELEGEEILAIRVPVASPEHQPVHLSKDEKLCYIRQQEADVQCSDADIARMRRNRDVFLIQTYSLDDHILPHSTLDDIDSVTLRKFRNRMRDTPMGTLWQHESDEGLLRKLRAYRTDRATGETGVTLAGLLMFGKHDSILDLWPSFQLDYFEYENSSDENARWSDRLTNDGSWAGNLYEFTFQVLGRLQLGLKRPFELNKDMTRKGETLADIALREAVANTIIHADYWVDAGIRITKRPEGLKFVNPGTMLVNKDTLFTDSEQVSICRNKNLQRMFQALGMGDKAGSGVEKITKGWFDTCLAFPQISEQANPWRVVWFLPSVGMIPRKNLDAIIHRIGSHEFSQLSSFEKLVLVCVPFDSFISHGDIQNMLPMHPADLSRYLSRFVERGYLKTKGRTRGMKYCWSEANARQMSQLHGNTEQMSQQMSHLTREVADNSSTIGAIDNKWNEEELPLFNQMSQLEGNSIQMSHLMSQLPESVLKVKASKKVSQEEMETAICDLCRDRWVTSVEMASILGREKRTLLRILRSMVLHHVLKAKEEQTNHPQQAYQTEEKL